MSKHHHHANEGHSAGTPSRSVQGHLRHNAFFYISGIFILVALIAFIMSGNLLWTPTIAPLQSNPQKSGGK